MIHSRVTHLHAFGLMNRKAGSTKFTATYVTSYRPWPFLYWRWRRSRWYVEFFLIDHFLYVVLILIAMKIQGDGFLNSFRYRGFSFLTQRAVLRLRLWMTVEPFRLVRFTATLARFRRAFYRRGCKHLQIVLYDGSWIPLLQRGQRENLMAGCSIPNWYMIIVNFDFILLLLLWNFLANNFCYFYKCISLLRIFATSKFPAKETITNLLLLLSSFALSRPFFTDTTSWPPIRACFCILDDTTDTSMCPSLGSRICLMLCRL